MYHRQRSVLSCPRVDDQQTVESNSGGPTDNDKKRGMGILARHECVRVRENNLARNESKRHGGSILVDPVPTYQTADPVYIQWFGSCEKHLSDVTVAHIRHGLRIAYPSSYRVDAPAIAGRGAPCRSSANAPVGGWPFRRLDCEWYDHTRKRIGPRTECRIIGKSNATSCESISSS